MRLLNKGVSMNITSFFARCCGNNGAKQRSARSSDSTSSSGSAGFRMWGDPRHEMSPEQIARAEAKAAARAGSGNQTTEDPVARYLAFMAKKSSEQHDSDDESQASITSAISMGVTNGS